MTQMPNVAVSIKNRGCAEARSLLDELNGAVAVGTEKQRLRIFERVTDLFTAGSRSYSSDQIALFDDVLQELVIDIEVTARAKLAHRLAHVSSAPPKIIRLLAFDDEIEVAEPILVHSEQLSDADLIENARSKSQKHLFAIAQRLKLSEPVTDILVERGDNRVVHKVVRNKGARFSLAGYGKLAIRARADQTLMRALGERTDVPRQYFLKLLETASASVRSKFERANPKAAAEIREAIDDVATTMQREARRVSSPYAAAMRDAKRRFKVSPLTEVHVHAAAHAQEFDRAVIALSKVGRFPVDLVERALLDKGEDMVLVLARAAGCSWTTAKELLLMYVAERSLQPDDLQRAFERYQSLTERTALKIVDFYSRRMKIRAKKNARH